MPKINPGTTTHGKSRTRLHLAWMNVRQRCYNPNHPSYPRYGGRGITMCKRWFKFENFLADMGEPEKGMTLERIDNDKGYFPKNCRWATRKEQAWNTKQNVWIDTPQGKVIMAEAARSAGLAFTTLLYRVRQNWPADRLFKPAARYHKKSRHAQKT